MKESVVMSEHVISHKKLKKSIDECLSLETAIQFIREISNRPIIVEHIKYDLPEGWVQIPETGTVLPKGTLEAFERFEKRRKERSEKDNGN